MLTDPAVSIWGFMGYYLRIFKIELLLSSVRFMKSYFFVLASVNMILFRATKSSINPLHYSYLSCLFTLLNFDTAPKR
jgi:hypothetical protein